MNHRGRIALLVRRCAVGRRLFIYTVVTTASLAATDAGARTPLNGWQKLMVSIAARLSRGLDAEQGFTVEYNSSFADLDTAVILAPAAGGQRSSLNIITKCGYDATNLITTRGTDVPTFDESGNFKFGANATSPPNFITDGLANAKAGLALDRGKTTRYAFEDIAVRQLTQVATQAAVNAPACLRDLDGIDRIFVVRGYLVMRLTVEQTRQRAGSAELGVSLGRVVAIDAAKVGFDTTWSSNRDWRLRQKMARPWFRIVGKMERALNGRFRFVPSHER